MKWLSMLLLLLSFVTSCGSDDPAQKDEDKSKKQDNNTNLIDNKEPKDYFNQFLFKTESAADGKPQKFKYLTSGDVRMYDEGLTTRFFNIKLSLLESGNYTLVYSEYTKDRFGQIDAGSKVKAENKTGTWSINGVHLVLGDVATGSGMKVNNMDTVALVFSKDILTKGLKEQYRILYYGSSTEGL